MNMKQTETKRREQLGDKFDIIYCRKWCSGPNTTIQSSI